MQVFKAFFKILKKKSKSALITTIIFLAISFGIVYSGGSNKEFTESKLSITVIDEDNTEASKALTEFIGKKHELKETAADKEKLTEQLYWTTVDYALVIKKGFSENLSSGSSDELFGEYHLRESFSTVYMSTTLNEYVKTVRAFLASGSELGAALDSTSEILSKDTEVTFKADDAFGTEDFSHRFSGYFQYIPYICISVMLSALGIVLSSLNKKELRYRTDCSGTTPRSVTFQIIGASAIFVIAIWLIFMIAGLFLYGGIYRGHAWFAVLNSLIFTLVAASLAIFVSSFDLEENVFNVVTQIIGLGMSFLCGVFVPLSVLGDGVKSAARFLPAYWYIKANDMLTAREPFDGGKLAGYMLIQLAFAVVLMLLTLVVRRSSRSRTV